MASGRKVTALALFGALLFCAGPLQSRLFAQRGLEYEVKAAYLYNIVNFVTWPPDAFAGPNDPLHVCVYGADPFGKLLDNAMRNGTANKRPVQVRRVNDPAGLAPCEVVYLAGGNTDRIDQAVKSVAQRPALIVGETPDVLRRGGIIAFVVDGGRVRFDVNLAAATTHGVTLSARLLQVARTITGKGSSD